jgi:peptidoglycan glycosyltransferase
MTLPRRIWHIGTATTLLVLLLSLRLIYWPLLRADDLQPVVLNPLQAALTYSGRDDLKEFDLETLEQLDSLPQPVVQRTAELLANITRGAIYDRNGRALAYDVSGENGSLYRFYAEPSLAHTLGYVSGLRVGLTGLENRFNEALLGLDRIDSQFRQLIHQPIVGSNVHLTIDSRSQREAAAALGERAGAVVALDAQTGAVLAMVSAPGFDPNSMNNPDYVTALMAGCPPGACLGPLFNRATQGLYTPGSTWKTVTLIAGLDSGQVAPDTMFDFGEPRQGPDGPVYLYEVDGFLIEDPNHDERQLNLVRSFAVSANAAFARIGDEMPADILVEYARRLGFGRDEAPPIEIAASPAALANDPAALASNNVLRATTAFGQGELATSPLSMALVAAAVVNDGHVPAPHLVQAIIDPFGNVQQSEVVEPWIRGAMRPETAALVREMMIEVVRNGSGVYAAVPNLTVGGKTGTAEVGPSAAPHAWFIGFASNGQRTVAIAVLVENGGQGADVAAPIFSRLADVAISHLGEPVEEIIPPPVAP